MILEYPKRKRLRLPEYDYSQNGAYFITICTQNRETLFGDVGADSISARMISDIFEKTISEIVQTFKRRSTIEYIKLVKQGLTQPFDKKVWQRHITIILSETKKIFRMIRKYIDENPITWENDCFYV